jgi:hypothetical protein
VEPLQDRIAKIVQDGLADGRAELETLPNGHICGHVISSDFTDLSYEARGKKLNELLRRHLSAEDMVGVSVLLTYTPEEFAVSLKEV